jgi:hypothetical protein
MDGDPIRSCSAVERPMRARPRHSRGRFRERTDKFFNGTFPDPAGSFCVDPVEPSDEEREAGGRRRRACLHERNHARGEPGARAVGASVESTPPRRRRARKQGVGIDATLSLRAAPSRWWACPQVARRDRAARPGAARSWRRADRPPPGALSLPDRVVDDPARLRQRPAPARPRFRRARRRRRRLHRSRRPRGAAGAGALPAPRVR